MSFAAREQVRLSNIRDELFWDRGGGLHKGASYAHILLDPTKNLWAGIREDALDYFSRNSIVWWGGGGSTTPTGNLLSSQVACVNHLYALRQRVDLATAVLKAIDPEISKAEIVDDGFVEFEFIGSCPYLGESAFVRGANCTSVDAYMIGTHETGERRAFLIEWKYTELYKRRKDLYIHDRYNIYDPLISEPRSPFNNIDVRAFYFEPFYQMMRQALLGWQFTANRDHECQTYRCIQVVPQQNVKLRETITSPGLAGVTVHDAWSEVLKDRQTHMTIDPVELMKPVAGMADTKSLMAYLQRRYWDADLPAQRVKRARRNTHRPRGAK